MGMSTGSGGVGRDVLSVVAGAILVVVARGKGGDFASWDAPDYWNGRARTYVWSSSGGGRWLGRKTCPRRPDMRGVCTTITVMLLIVEQTGRIKQRLVVVRPSPVGSISYGPRPQVPEATACGLAGG